MSRTFGFSAPENQSSRSVQGHRPDSVAAAREDGVGSSVRMGTFPVTPEGSGGSSSSTGVHNLASLVSHPELLSGVVFRSWSGG
jgi:hypothetical protein